MTSPFEAIMSSKTNKSAIDDLQGTRRMKQIDEGRRKSHN